MAALPDVEKAHIGFLPSSKRLAAFLFGLVSADCIVNR